MELLRKINVIKSVRAESGYGDGETGQTVEGFNISVSVIWFFCLIKNMKGFGGWGVG